MTSTYDDNDDAKLSERFWICMDQDGKATRYDENDESPRPLHAERKSLDEVMYGADRQRYAELRNTMAAHMTGKLADTIADERVRRAVRGFALVPPGAWLDRTLLLESKVSTERVHAALNDLVRNLPAPCPKAFCVNCTFF